MTPTTKAVTATHATLLLPPEVVSLPSNRPLALRQQDLLRLGSGSAGRGFTGREKTSPQRGCPLLRPRLREDRDLPATLAAFLPRNTGPTTRGSLVAGLAPPRRVAARLRALCLSDLVSSPFVTSVAIELISIQFWLTALHIYTMAGPCHHAVTHHLTHIKCCLDHVTSSQHSPRAVRLQPE